ncbi:uncharacterized protein PG986_004372 [Apiospora aurea]|uniref:Uncharacterized protein n=1 Tax=Apiospora aurea TaxID=335848 RepID=A0ABR1QMF2_9PEZI
MSSKEILSAFKNGSAKSFPDLAQAESEWLPCRKTQGTFNFISPLPKWDAEKPFNLALPLPADQPKTNSVYDRHDVQISDGRGRESDFSLDVHGFAFAEVPDEGSLRSEDAIKTEYVARMELWLKEYLGIERVFAFDYAASSTSPCEHQTYICYLLAERWLSYARSSTALQMASGWFGAKEDRQLGMHILMMKDQTPEAAMSRLRLYFGNEAEGLAQKRVHVANPGYARSLRDSDLMAHDIVYAHYLGENYLVKHNDDHRWYYFSRMKTQECIIIKNFDSEVNGVPRC